MFRFLSGITSKEEIKKIILTSKYDLNNTTTILIADKEANKKFKQYYSNLLVYKRQLLNLINFEREIRGIKRLKYSHDIGKN